MKIVFHRNFEKQYKKLRAGEQKRVKDRLRLFMEDEFHSLLSNHPLRGAYYGYRSINIGGDLRAIYRHAGSELRIFVAIGIHTKLYR